MIRALDAVIEGLRRSPGDPVDLLVGEPCFDPPREIVAAFEDTAGIAVGGYGPPAGLKALRKILAERAGGEGTGPENIVVSHGAKGGLLVVLAGLVEPGDRVIHPLPCYPAYPAMVRRLGGVPVGVAETDAGFCGWTAAVVGAIGENVRAVILSSPSNPSGSVMRRDDLLTLIGACRDRGIRLILDEAYAGFRFIDDLGGPGSVPLADTVVRIASASKSLALPGWRIGWIIADPAVAARVAAVQGALLNPAATPPQRALLALPDVPPSYFNDTRTEVSTRLEALAGAMRAAGFEAAVPDGGFYLWVDVRDRIEDGSTIDWCVRLARENGVGLWPGEDFGAPGWVRAALPQGDGWRDQVAELEGRLGSFC